MSVDLSKCKVGDKVNLRNGKVATIIEVREKPLFGQYPIVHDSGYKDGYMASNMDGTSCLSFPEEDIVSIVAPKPVKKNVAKCKFYNTCGKAYSAVVKINGVSWEHNYSFRKDAIRGARRLCERIGFECEIVEDAK